MLLHECYNMCIYFLVKITLINILCKKYISKSGSLYVYLGVSQSAFDCYLFYYFDEKYLSCQKLVKALKSRIITESETSEKETHLQYKIKKRNYITNICLYI